VKTVILEGELVDDFDIIGVSSSEQAYRLAWAINRTFGWRLSKARDIVSSQRHGSSCHDCYEHVSDNEMLRIHLIDNKTADGVLLPEMNTFDFLLKITDIHQVLGEDFYKKLRKIPYIMAIFQVETVKLNKSPQMRYLEELG
jgi:hypothetical protein